MHRRVQSLAFLAVFFLTLSARAQTAGPDRAALDAMSADAVLRQRLAEEIVAAHEPAGREFAPAFRATLIERLKNLSADELQKRRANGLLLTPDAIGDTAADLTYTPLSAPCRIIDTRTGGGALTGGAPGPQRSFLVAGNTNLGPQGGSATGCGIPVGATAVLINFVAVNPQGVGNLRGSAYPNAVPTTGSIVNYQSLTPALNIANGLMFPICNPAVSTCTEDITVLANGAGTDVVADVLGYSQRFPREQVRSFTVTNFSATVNSLSTTCNADLGAITINAPVAGNVHVEGNVQLTWVHTLGTDPHPVIDIDSTVGTCGGGPVGLSTAYIANQGTGGPATGTYFPEFHLDGVFPVTAGPNTFYIQGLVLNATTDTVQFHYGGLVARFEPN